MHHCVSSYSGTCREGQSRIFSVRLNGERVSTLQIAGSKSLERIDGATTFSIVQNRGKYNAPVSRQCDDFCQEVLERARKTWPAITREIHKKIHEREREIEEAARHKKEELAKKALAHKTADEKGTLAAKPSTPPPVGGAPLAKPKIR